MNSKFFFLIFCAFYFQLIGLDRGGFYAKLSQPTPAWMIEQIEEDLAPFKKELSKKFLDEFFKKDDLYLVRVRIAKGRISIQKSGPAQFHSTPDKILAGLHILSNLITLPDIDFVFTAHDGLLPKFPTNSLSNPLENSEFQQFDENELVGPVFCITQRSHKIGAILMPDMFALEGFNPGKALILEGNQIYPWELKENIIFYRGSDMGIMDLSIWKTHPRPMLVALSTQHPELIDAKFTSLYSPWHKQYAIEKGYMGSFISLKEHTRYKYLINVDAACAATPRFPLLLHSNSVVFKNITDSILWFFKTLKPYQHYIPVAGNISDLFTQLEWAKTHDKECKKISENARRLAAEVLTEEAVYLYLYRLLEAYSNKQRNQYFLE